MTAVTRVRDTLAAGGGAALGGVFRVVGSLRPATKPLHPRGRLVTGVLDRRGLDEPVGSVFVDEPGTADVLVRVSRAIGLPAPLPDIHGLAIRVPFPTGGHGDLLLASTGWGRLTRFLLTGGRRPESRPLTTLVPYRTDAGRLVLLGARVESEDRAVLACAVGTGPWQPFAELRIGPGERDAVVSFDPVRHPLPGLAVPDWVRRLREPAYAGARRSRD